jgi:hypothetical protein
MTFRKPPHAEKLMSDAEYEAKWKAVEAESNRNNPGRRRKCTIQCDVEGVEYEVGDMMPMKHYRIMRTMHDVFAAPE